jgi:hypothetical protein
VSDVIEVISNEAVVEVVSSSAAIVEIVETPVQVLEVVTPGAQGIQGEQGDPGDPAELLEVLHHTHAQMVPSASWTITHGLAFRPNISVTDSAGSVVEGDVIYLNDTTVRLDFSGAFSGVAYLS